VGKRAPQIVRNGIGKGFQFLVGGFEFGGAFLDALLEFFIELADLLLGAAAANGVEDGTRQVVPSYIDLRNEILRATLDSLRARESSFSPVNTMMATPRARALALKKVS
jgi:hypothetical protein